MNHKAMADEVFIDGDETGWHLIVFDDEGNRFNFNIHGIAFDFAGSPGLKALLDWRGEGESIRAEVRASRFAVDPAEGYEPDNPEHPGYHDLMSGLADDR